MPLMPMIHDAVWYGTTALGALFVWKAAPRLGLRLPTLDLAGFNLPTLHRRQVAGTPPAAEGWFRTTVRSSGNTAFDDWRDTEIARLEAERRALEARLHAFEDFVDRIKRAKDRATFDRFMASFREPSHEGRVAAGPDADDGGDHRPG